MLLTKEVEIKWDRANIKYYKEKGYVYTKLKDIFKVPIEIVPEGSHVIVDVLCDYCTETIIKKQYNTYIKQNKKSKIHKDCCEKCWHLKLSESMLLKYGKNNASNIVEFQNKRTDSFFERFGVNTPLKNDDIKQKIIATNIKRYGVSHLMKMYI
jgi:hypothetical protein